MAHDRPAPPDELSTLVEFRSKDDEVLIGADANAQHSVWGSSDINDRAAPAENAMNRGLSKPWNIFMQLPGSFTSKKKIPRCPSTGITRRRLQQETRQTSCLRQKHLDPCGHKNL